VDGSELARAGSGVAEKVNAEGVPKAPGTPETRLGERVVYGAWLVAAIVIVVLPAALTWLRQAPEDASFASSGAAIAGDAGALPTSAGANRGRWSAIGRQPAPMISGSWPTGSARR
jgi:hypothetical protein